MNVRLINVNFGQEEDKIKTSFIDKFIFYLHTLIYTFHRISTQSRHCIHTGSFLISDGVWGYTTCSGCDSTP